MLQTRELDLYLEGQSFIARTVSKTRYSAKNIRNLTFEIDTDYVMAVLLVQKGKCALTGWDLEFTRGGDWNGKNPRGASIDRIDGSQGYVRGNIQITCIQPNLIKNKMHNDDFIAMAKAIAKKNKG
jgi:hypothetical protein